MKLDFEICAAGSCAHMSAIEKKYRAAGENKADLSEKVPHEYKQNPIPLHIHLVMEIKNKELVVLERLCGKARAAKLAAQIALFYSDLENDPLKPPRIHGELKPDVRTQVNLFVIGISKLKLEP